MSKLNLPTSALGKLGFFKTTDSDSDYLHVTLDEDPTFDDIQGVLRVQPSGEVFLQ